MVNIVEWCNNNSGFFSGILSLLTLVVSIIAVIISIHTARLPYKKKLVLNSNISFLFSIDNLSEQTISKFNGISIEATNIGNRNINISFLGFAIKDGWKTKKMQTRDRDLGGKGVLAPTEVATVEYTSTGMACFSELKPRTRIFCYATDTEGKKYSKYFGRAGKTTKNLRDMH